MSYRYRIATVFLIGFFIDCINIFMSAVAMPRIAAELHVSNANVAWVANAYVLGLTLIVPLSTWLAALWGARKLLAGSMLVFGIAAGLCGQAATFNELIIWRLMQGMAGGLLIPVGQALTYNLFQGQQRVRISTLVMAVALIAPAMSPTLGGMVVDHHSWRWVFRCSIPVALVAASLAWCWVRVERCATAPARPDLDGLLLVSAALTSVLMGMSLYGAGHSASLALACVAAGGLCAARYQRHYRTTPHAIVELRLLKSAGLRASILMYYAIPGVFTGVNLLNIFFMQDSLGLSAQTSGMFMIVYAGGALMAMLLCGQAYHSVGARPLFVLSMGLHSAGIATLFLVNSAADVTTLAIAYGLMGIGGGIGANTAQATALIDFSGHDTQQASVIWNINRQMAFSLGAALLPMIYNLLLAHLDTSRAYHTTFLIASVLGLLPLLHNGTLNTDKEHHAQPPN